MEGGQHQTPSTQNPHPTTQEYTSTPPDPTGGVSRQSFINGGWGRGLMLAAGGPHGRWTT